jgi:NAD-dependent SIR2 family protein deacetylase
MQIASLRDFIARHRRLFILTGAGCSTDSGIPDYRDGNGDWKRSPPVNFQSFMGSEAVRRRYWARSLIGWQRFRRAGPNAAHAALARLEQRGRLGLLVTQNVDGLHQAAGSTNVIDLHGRLDRVRCMECDGLVPREELQGELLRRNPQWGGQHGLPAPDGDADVEGLPFDEFVVPACTRCDGILKPDVVFFGERSAPPGRGGDAPARAGRRCARSRLLADGVLRLPVRARGREIRQTDRCGQSRSHARRRAVDPEGIRALRVGAGLRAVAAQGE